MRAPAGSSRRTLTRPASGRVPAPASSLPPAPTAPQAAPQARAEPARVPRRLGALSGRVPPCPCLRLPSGDRVPRTLHGALLYPSRSRWPCRAPARGLSPCARLPRGAREPSGRGPAGVARPRNSMQLRPPPQLLPGEPPGAWRPLAAPAPLCPSARREPVFRARLGSPRASPRVGERPPPLRRLANNQAPLVSRQRNLRNALARAHSHSRAHTQAHAGGEPELGRRSFFLPYPKKLPTLTLANCCSSVLDYSPRRPSP